MGTTITVITTTVITTPITRTTIIIIAIITGTAGISAQFFQRCSDERHHLGLTALGLGQTMSGLRDDAAKP
jgi:hypothetical protein